MKLKDVILKIKKYLTKPVLIAGLAILLGVAGYTIYNLRSKLLLTRSELVAAKVVTSVVEAEKHRLDSLIGVYVDSIARRDIVILQKDSQIKKQGKEITKLEQALKDTLNEVAEVSADSSYKYINLRVKPTAELKYRFDSLQVKTIHYTFVERDGLFGINTKLNSLVGDLQQVSSLKDNQITELKTLNSVYISKESILRKENESQHIEIVGLNKAVKRQKFAKTVSNCAVLGLGGYILINAIVK